MAKRYEHSKTYQLVVRIIGILTVAAGLNYIVWRYASSLNTQALWFSIPMVIAETYGIIDMLLFVMMSWRQPDRRPPASPEKATVDVFITTYNEAETLVEKTARAALNIDWPDKQVYILDDGNRESMQKLATDLGCGYISRGQEWDGKPRHAKAGNVNNALLQTSGEFILILDADQIPMPSILKKPWGSLPTQSSHSSKPHNISTTCLRAILSATRLPFSMALFRRARMDGMPVTSVVPMRFCAGKHSCS